MSGISSASLVDLKAELFRKQEEFKKQKLLNASTNYIKGKTTEKKPTIFSRKNAGVAARAQKDLVAKTEEENLLEKSRRTLEAKEKLYNQITKDSEIPDEDGSQRFLVDFQKKAIDKIQEEQRKKEKEEEKEDDEDEDEFVDSPSNPDEKWVEYTDSLGRTRTCMKKDLERMQIRDKEMGLLPASQKKEEEETVDNSNKASDTLSSQEIYCQMLKDKWNKEEEESQSKPVGPVHYENVRFDEIRTHGVGYYQFSKDEMERKGQMDLLKSIRDQTKDERVKRHQLKEKRDNLMSARLKKIKDRQRAKLGLPPEPEIEDEPSPEPIIENIPKEVKPDDVPKKPPPVREWDLGKDKLWESEKNYFRERRDERESKFAPPSFYYSSNAPSAPKRKEYQERQYSPPPQKKPVPQKLKKDKIKQQQEEKKIKEKKLKTYEEIIPDLSTIPLPGESIPSKMATEDQDEKLTNNTNSTIESQSGTPSNNTIPSQMWGQPAAMTASQYNAIYAAAYTNQQQQSIYPGNVAIPTTYLYTQPSSPVSIVTQQTIEPEKPKPPSIVDRRFVRNEETLQEL